MKMKRTLHGFLHKAMPGKESRSRSSTHRAVCQAVLLVIPSTDCALVILELKQIIPTTATPPDQGTEGEQTDNDQGTKSRNKAVAPPITTTGSKFEKRPKQIVSGLSLG